MLDPRYEYTCPYCGELQSELLDVAGGRQQDFVTDCDVCCRPIHIRYAWDGETVAQFAAEVEA